MKDTACPGSQYLGPAQLETTGTISSYPSGIEPDVAALTDSEFYPPEEKKRILRNIVVTGVAFMVHFTAYHGVSNLQSTINKTAGLGTDSLAAVYLGLILSNLFLPVVIIRAWQCFHPPDSDRMSLTEKMREELEGLEDFKPEEKWRILRNVLILSLAFMVHFTAFQGAANLQSSVNSSAGLGTASLATIYGALILSNVFLPVVMIRILRPISTVSEYYGQLALYQLLPLVPLKGEFAFKEIFSQLCFTTCGARDTNIL
uniref:Uncharacterized protein n=1 Tax=Timema monikensis TaxID=170555 RepID=A0A7R9HKS3_9NEOP|nr:unnamed protein product [Timema monikensis]